MRYLPDTNIIIAALNGEPSVRAELNALGPKDEVILSLVVWAEMRYGALCSQRKDENLERVETLRTTFPIVEISLPIAMRFSEIKAALRKRGITKSDLDLLIASTAVEENAVLITDDRALLDGSIPGLTAQNWRA